MRLFDANNLLDLLRHKTIVWSLFFCASRGFTLSYSQPPFDAYLWSKQMVLNVNVCSIGVRRLAFCFMHCSWSIEKLMTVASHDWEWLAVRRFANGKWKVDAGADFGVTQLFYDCSLYFDYLKKVHLSAELLERGGKWKVDLKLIEYWLIYFRFWKFQEFLSAKFGLQISMIFPSFIFSIFWQY